MLLKVYSFTQPPDGQLDEQRQQQASQRRRRSNARAQKWRPRKGELAIGVYLMFVIVGQAQVCPGAQSALLRPSGIAQVGANITTAIISLLLLLLLAYYCSSST